MTESPRPDRIPITVEVSPDQKQEIERLAERKGLSPEAVVRAAIDHELETTSPNGNEEDDPSGSFLDGIEHLVGSVDGPSDLSSNPDHMEGYGRS